MSEKDRDLKCDMVEGCKRDVAYIDPKGFIYCKVHGLQRQANGRQARKLTPAELNKLKRGEQIKKY